MSTPGSSGGFHGQLLVVVPQFDWILPDPTADGSLNID